MKDMHASTLEREIYCMVILNNYYIHTEKYSPKSSVSRKVSYLIQQYSPYHICPVIVVCADH